MLKHQDVASFVHIGRVENCLLFVHRQTASYLDPKYVDLTAVDIYNTLIHNNRIKKDEYVVVYNRIGKQQHCILLNKDGELSVPIPKQIDVVISTSSHITNKSMTYKKTELVEMYNKAIKYDKRDEYSISCMIKDGKGTAYVFLPIAAELRETISKLISELTPLTGEIRAVHCATRKPM